MYSILLNVTFVTKVWQSLHCLLICGNSMLYCAKTSICWSYINNLFRNLVIFRHRSITTVFKRSSIQNFAAIFEFVWLRVVTAISFATQTNIIYVHWISSLNRPGSRVSCILCIAQQVREKEFVIELAENSSVQSPLCRELDTFFIAGRIQSNKSCSDNAR